ncbi:MAG: hypothetical protein WC967_15880, partial [Balneolaceae bacterium]
AQQFVNRVEVSDYTADTLETIAVEDIDSTLSFGSALTVTADAATVAAAKTAVNEANPDFGETFVLTTGADTFVGTEKNDLFDGSAKNTLTSNDVLLDSTTTDADILNATVTTSTVAARLQNIETLNITGEYVTTGLALTNVSGTTNLNLNTNLAGGTASVADANSVNASNINAGTNISTLKVTSLASGTRDTVNVDAGNANVEITGKVGGADKYSVTIAAGKTLTTTAMDSTGDTLAVNAQGNFTLVDSAAAGIETATITNNAAESITVTVDEAQAIADKITLSGNDIVLKATQGSEVSGVEITSDAASSTVELVAGASVDLKAAVVDKVVASGALTTGITVNESSKLILDKNQTALTLNIDNAKGTMTADSTTGTLLLEVNASQTAKITTDTHIDTLFVTAGKLANNTDGTAQTVTFTDLDVSAAATETVVVSGANDLIISKLTGAADDKVIATSMGGKLTINDFVANTTVYGSNNGDTYKATTVASVLDLKAGTGNDTIDLSASTASNKIDAGAGDDLIIAGKGGDTIKAGTGNDTVSIAAALNASTTTTVTLGAGSDKVILDDGAGAEAAGATAKAVTITDFAKGTDTLVLTGDQTASLDLTALTAPTSNEYNVDGYIVTLKDVTATDLSDSIQLGHGAMTVNGTPIVATTFEAVTGATIVAGAKDDYIGVTTTGATAVSSTITTGAGADTVVLTHVDTATGVATATINDFTVGTDKIIVNGDALAGLTLDLTKMATPTTGDYTINTYAVLNLSKDNVNFTTTDISEMVQLGLSAAAAYNVAASTTAITGGIFDDFIDLSAASATATKVSFIDNGGMDTISGFVAGTGKDTLSFDKLTGIDSDGINLTAETKVTAATNGAVYVMKDKQEINADTIDYSKIGTTVDGAVVKVTDASIMADVAAYIANALDKEAAGEKYIAVINDTSTSAAVDAYAYAVTVNAEGGITADDITLIGTVNTGAGTLLTDANIA